MGSDPILRAAQRLAWGEPVRSWTRAAEHPGGVVRLAGELAQDASAGVPVRYVCHALRARCRSVSELPGEAARWIRSCLDYTRETPGLEVLAGPVSTLRSGGGDCDDLSILHASICRAAGIDAFPAAIRWPGGPWAHMVSWTPPAAPWELSEEAFYGAGPAAPQQRTGRFELMAWDPARGTFLERRNA